MDSKKIKILIVLVFLVVLLLDASMTYSKYISSTSGNVNYAVAKWKIKIGPTFGSETMTLTPSLLTSSSYVKSGTIAPGSIGYFDVFIDPSAIEVAFKYTLSITTTGNDVTDFKPVRYKMVTTSGTSAPSSFGTATITDVTSTTPPTNVYDVTSASVITTATKYYTGTVYEKICLRVYVRWVEGTGESLNDAADTNLGTTSVTTQKYGKIQVTIAAEQVL